MKLKGLFAGMAAATSAAMIFSVGALAYSDVPQGHWAENVISEATDAGIMQGRGNDEFGLGETIKRSEFAAMLVRLMDWEQSSDTVSQFEDNLPGSWYFSDVNTLAAHGAVDGNTFRPEDNITRREMAVMLVKALGYDSIAKGQNVSSFTDVSQDAGYIETARDFGIITGKSDTVFDPEGPALREEGAAMMMRLYDKYYSKLTEIHGFYAISSWGQRDLAAQMDSVSFGWSRLEYTEGGSVYLNTTTENSNSWYIPDGYEDAVSYIKNGGAEENFAVTMTDTEDSEAILTDSSNREAAADMIITAAEKFDGVTIDFEGMKGAELRNGLNEFVKTMREKLGDKKLYVAVHPVLKNSAEYYDAYDYRTIGEYADRVILMAHDYAASTMPDNLLNTDFIDTPVTPFDEVYYTLKKITDPQTGVIDVSKIELGVSLSSTAAWKTENGKIVENQAVHPSMETVRKRLAQADTVISYSDTYRNPYARYKTEDGSEYVIWYEDSRSISDKTELAKMFGIDKLSIWRIGEISTGQQEQYMDIWNTVLNEK